MRCSSWPFGQADAARGGDEVVIASCTLAGVRGVDFCGAGQTQPEAVVGVDVLGVIGITGGASVLSGHGSASVGDIDGVSVAQIPAADEVVA